MIHPNSRVNESSPDPQGNVAHPVPAEAPDETIEGAADEMASKAGKSENAFEHDDTVGGVRSNSGGIFSK